MNIRDLDYFYHLSQLHSFTAVAQQCQVSQPTITYAVKRLEEQFDCHLFVKDPSHRTVVLTREGEILANHAASILTELTVLDKEIKRSIQAKPRVGFPPIIRARILSQLMEKDLDLNFLSELEFESLGSLDLLDQLVAGDLDFSLLGSLQPLNHPKLEVNELYQLPFEFLLSSQHPLAQRKELSFGDVLEERFILLDEGHVHMEAFNRLNDRYQGQVNPFLELKEVATIAQLVEKNAGISLVTSDLTAEEDRPGLVRVPLVPSDRLYFHVSYAYTKTTVLPQVVQRFITVLEEMV